MKEILKVKDFKSKSLSDILYLVDSMSSDQIICVRNIDFRFYLNILDKEENIHCIGVHFESFLDITSNFNYLDTTILIKL